MRYIDCVCWELVFMDQILSQPWLLRIWANQISFSYDWIWFNWDWIQWISLIYWRRPFHSVVEIIFLSTYVELISLGLLGSWTWFLGIQEGVLNRSIFTVKMLNFQVFIENLTFLCLHMPHLLRDRDHWFVLGVCSAHVRLHYIEIFFVSLFIWQISRDFGFVEDSQDDIQISPRITFLGICWVRKHKRGNPTAGNSAKNFKGIACLSWTPTSIKPLTSQVELCGCFL